MGIARKKVFFLVIVICFIILLIPPAIRRISLKINADMINHLKGKVYYLKRVNGILSLYKSEANMKNEKVIYSNKGKGELKSGGSNDNIIDFRFFPETGKLEFQAIHNGKWSILGITEGETKPTYIREPKEVKVLENYRITEIDTDYVSCKHGNVEIYEKKGSLYMKENGQEKCIKRFIGIYSDKFTGYRPVGLSPDGRYLIYSSLGAFLGSLVNEKRQYIMDLKTGKSAAYIDAIYIQWVL